MNTGMSLYIRRFLPGYFCLFMLLSCSYPRPAGEWLSLDASTIYFAGVTLADEDIETNYSAVCKEAREEIYTQLANKLAERIAPLTLKTKQTSDIDHATTITLKLNITHCEVDVEQSGGSFTYYLTLPLKVSLTQNNKNLLSYNMDTYEQVNIDTPTPEFEFTFAEPVARTLQLLNGKQLWRPDN